MKHTILIILLITFCIPHISFAMDHHPKNDIPLQQLPADTFDITTVNSINAEINKQYPPNNCFVNFCRLLLLTEEDMRTIINLTNQPDSNISPALIDALRKKNIFFDEALNYFSNLTRNNRDAVTYKTIDIIDQQPIPQLKSVALPIKNYIMQQVQDKCKLTYDIDLTHTHTVRLFAVHPTTDRAVTHSTDNQLRIWDLTTGSMISNFTEKDPIVLIQFNADGSLMATAAPYTTRNHEVKSHIKIRKVLSEPPLDTFTQNNRVYHINFMQDSSNNNNILATFAQEEKNIHGRSDRILTMWQRNDEQKFAQFGSSSPLPWRGDTLIEFLSDKEKYDGCINDENDKIVRITKKKCAALHLCKQTIENNDCLNSLTNIKQKQVYLQLTEYEKKLIKKDITECISQAEKNTPMYLALQRK